MSLPSWVCMAPKEMYTTIRLSEFQEEEKVIEIMYWSGECLMKDSKKSEHKVTSVEITFILCSRSIWKVYDRSEYTPRCLFDIEITFVLRSWSIWKVNDRSESTQRCLSDVKNSVHLTFMEYMKGDWSLRVYTMLSIWRQNNVHLMYTEYMKGETMLS